MKCPYCDQEHSDSLKFCPITGKTILPIMLKPDLAHYQAISSYDDTLIPVQEVTQPKGESNENPTPRLSDTQPTRIYTSVSDIQPTSIKSLTPSSHPPEPKKRHPFRWITCGCLGIPLVIVLLLAIFLRSDPFNLNLWGRVSGKYDSAAEVMPANTGIYMGINIGNMLLTRIDRVVAPFSSTEEPRQSPSGANYRPSQANLNDIQRASMIDNLLQQIESETGVKVPGDLMPWIGQYAGVGIVDFQATPAGSVVPSGWIIALETRNVNRADAFLETLQNNLANRQGYTFNTEVYQGAKLTIQSNSTDDENALAFGRSGRMLLIASRPTILMNAIDTPGTQSLEVNAEYQKLLNDRPRTWSASIYIDREAAGEDAEFLWQNGPLSSLMPLISPLPVEAWTGMQVNATAITNGLRFDIFTTYDPSKQISTDAEVIDSWNQPNGDLIRILPQDTLTYLSGPRFERAWEKTILPIISGGFGGNSFVTNLDRSFGISLQDELLNHLNGPWAWYVVPSPDQDGGGLVFNFLAQADNGLNMQSLVDKINNGSQEGGFRVESQTAGGLIFYQLTYIGNTRPVFTFSSNGGYVAFSSNSDTLKASFSNEPSLLGSTTYQDITRAFPGGMQLSFYIDMEGLLARLRSVLSPGALGSFNSGMSFLEPIKLIASGSRLVESGVTQNAVVLILKSR